MAELRSTTAIGGNIVWHGGNLRFEPQGQTIRYHGYKLYTEKDRPHPHDLGEGNGGSTSAFTKFEAESRFAPIIEGGYIGKFGGVMSGKLTNTGNEIEIRGSSPRLLLQDNDGAKRWYLINDANNFSIRENDTSGTRFRIDSSYTNMLTDNISIHSKVAFRGYDAWLRINDQSAFTTGVYFGSSIVRTDGTIHIGSSGATFNASSSAFTYKGGKIFHEAYHPNADKWTTARTITLDGDATGSVSIDGSSNRTLTVAVKDNSHEHNMLYAVDKRDVKPNTTGLSTFKGIRAYFTSREGLSGAPGTDYQDLLVLDTYGDSSGGKPNALAFDKSNHRILHYNAGYDADTWGSPKTIAYVEDTLGKTANAVSASKWATARTITLAGDATGSVSIDGTANTTLTVSVADDSHTHDGRYYTEAESNGRFLYKGAKAVDSDKLDGLDSTAFWKNSGSWRGTLHTDKTRVYGVSYGNGEVWFGFADGKGNVITDGEYFASEGNSRVFHDTYHPNADKWTTARTITLDGDASGSVSIDGTANKTLTVTVANDSHTHDGRYYTEAESNARFLYKSSDTMNGKLTLSESSGSTNLLSLVNSTDGWTWLRMTGGTAAITGSKVLHLAWNTLDYKDIPSNSFHIRPGGANTSLFIHGDMVGSIKPLQIGSTAGGGWGSTTIASKLTSYMEIVAPYDSTHKQSSGIMFHHRGTLTASIGFNSLSQSSSEFRVMSDDFHASTPLLVAGVAHGTLRHIGEYVMTSGINRNNYKGKSDNAVVGQLMWKNYGNGHVIFDASNGTSPSGVAIDKTNPSVGWTATYPTLMGWNGSTTYGVRVDVARKAELFGGKGPSGYASSSHTHDDRYYTESESNSRFLYKGEKAADSDKLDGLDSTSFARTDIVETFNTSIGIGGAVPGNTFNNGKAIALGDSDTGVRQNGDGQLELWANNQQVVHINTTSLNSLKPIQQNGTNVSLDGHTHDSRYQRVYRSTKVIESSNYSTLLKVTGGSLASGVSFRIKGTSNSVVINADVKILANHSGDIVLSAISGIYTQLYLRVISNNNDEFAVEVKRQGPAGTTSVEVEVRPLCNETVTFPSSHAYSGAVLEVLTNPGTVHSASGGASHDIRTDGTLYVNNTNKVFADNYHPNADKWTTARTITLAGDASGSVSIDGTANTTLTVTVNDDSHSHSHIVSDLVTENPSDTLQYFQSSGNTTINPTSDWWNTIRMGHGNPSTYYSNTIAVKMTGSNAGDLYTRTIANGTPGSWNRFWHSNNDGSGSGLDADLLDGLQASSFARTSGTYGELRAQATTAADVGLGNVPNWSTATFDGRYLAKGAKAVDSDKLDGLDSTSFSRVGHTHSGHDIRVLGHRLTVDSDGKIRSNHTSYRRAGMYGIYDPNRIDHIWSMGNSFVIDPNGANFGSLYGLAYKHTNNTTGGTMAGGHQGVWCINGSPKVAFGENLWTSGNVTAYSDRRVKTDIETIPNALSKIHKLGGYTFKRTDVEYDEQGCPSGPVRQTGVIAQEVLEVLPEAVTGDEEGYYSVAYGNMVGLLIEAIKELDDKVDSLQTELKETQTELKETKRSWWKKLLRI